MTKDTLSEAFGRTRVIGTHCHHFPDAFFAEDFGLAKLLQNSYVSWIQTGIAAEDIGRELPLFLSGARHNSYFVWLQKALQRIYGIDAALTGETAALYDEAIRSAHTDPAWHLKLMKERCGYERVILDTYWSPGGDNGHPELFAPTYRVNMFLYGYDATLSDHSDNNCYAATGTKKPADIEEYCALMESAIAAHQKGGACALKMAHAYEHTLECRRASRDEANAVFQGKGFGLQDTRSFQDYVTYQICRIAAKLDIPLQIHTGLGQLTGTRAMGLKTLIEDNPDTKFVLFHIGYPWMDDIFALTHYYPNVYPDLCWLPLISPTAAEYALGQLLDIGSAEKLFWGCDTWTGEESFGALLAAQHVFSRVLEARIDAGLTDKEGAAQVIEDVFHSNPKALYRI